MGRWAGVEGRLARTTGWGGKKKGSNPAPPGCHVTCASTCCPEYTQPRAERAPGTTEGEHQYVPTLPAPTQAQHLLLTPSTSRQAPGNLKHARPSCAPPSPPPPPTTTEGSLQAHCGLPLWKHRCKGETQARTSPLPGLHHLPQSVKRRCSTPTCINPTPATHLLYVHYCAAAAVQQHCRLVLGEHKAAGGGVQEGGGWGAGHRNYSLVTRATERKGAKRQAATSSSGGRWGSVPQDPAGAAPALLPPCPAPLPQPSSIPLPGSS